MFKISSQDFTSTWNLGTWRISKEEEFKENVLLPKFINLSTCQAQEMISIGNLMQISVGIIFFHDPKACPWFMPYVSGIKILMSGHYNAGKLETKHHLITTTSSWNISRAHSMGGGGAGSRRKFATLWTLKALSNLFPLENAVLRDR